MQKHSEEVRVFFEGWRLYQKVIDHNYMVHREVSLCLKRRLAARSGRPLSVLELGCGDAYVVSQILDAVPVGVYCGIDLSTMALEFARKNLEARVESVELIGGDIRQELSQRTGRYDVILAGYSLHHLSGREKQRALCQCRALLKKSGVLFLYDLLNEENEGREAFLNRCVSHFHRRWTGLTAEELDGASRHVLQHDYPAPLSAWKEMCGLAGFEKCVCRYRDENKMFGILEIRQTSNTGASPAESKGVSPIKRAPA